MSSRYAAAAILAGVVIAAALHGSDTAYFTVLNDFWGNAFSAAQWEWSAQQQWNGFFPPGYPTILRMLPGPRLVQSAYLFNVASGAVLLAVVWSFSRRWAGDAAAMLGMLMVAGHPLTVTQVLTTGPDATFVALAVSGALIVFAVAGGGAQAASWAFAAGASLGAACWIRFHGVNWGAAVLLAGAVIGGRSSLPALARAGAVFVLMVVSLGLVGLVAGDLGALTRDQAFNVYSHHVHPVNWFHLEREPIPKTISEAIARDPQTFLRSYLAFSAPHLVFAVFCLAAAAIATGLARRFAVFVLLIGLAFVPVVNLGGSPRGLASFVPLVFLALTWATVDQIGRIGRDVVRRVAGAVALVGVLAYVWASWVPEIVRYIGEARYRSGRASEVEAILRQDRVRLGTQVFAVADFYFVHAPGWHVGNYFPRIKGGWPTLDLPGFLETYPPPSTANLDAFLDDCQRFGVSHLVLSEASGAMLRELGQLFDGRLTSDRTVDIGGVQGMRVFRIVR